MRKGYWFVKLCENSSPSLSRVKTQVLKVMKKLRGILKANNLDDNVFLA